MNTFYDSYIKLLLKVKNLQKVGNHLSIPNLVSVYSDVLQFCQKDLQY